MLSSAHRPSAHEPCRRRREESDSVASHAPNAGPRGFGLRQFCAAFGPAPAKLQRSGMFIAPNPCYDHSKPRRGDTMLADHSSVAPPGLGEALGGGVPAINMTLLRSSPADGAYHRVGCLIAVRWQGGRGGATRLGPSRYSSSFCSGSRARSSQNQHHVFHIS